MQPSAELHGRIVKLAIARINKALRPKIVGRAREIQP